MRIREIRAILFFHFTFFSFLIATAQQFGGTPSSVKWKQVNTNVSRIIFPSGLDSVATRIAVITEEMQRNHSATIGDNMRKVNIVLRPYNIISNGYVALGPFRSEFGLMPPQDALELDGQNWADNLVIHEFRHAQQYSNFKNGLSKTMSILFGENGQAVANGASIPDWFFEGDAVYNETSLSYQGRGRLPLFFSGYRSLYNSSKQYNFMQLRNGSYKNYIPDHYQLGYLLVAYGREKYGNDIWLKITQDASAFKPLLYPMQGAVKKYTGISYDEFVKNAFAYYHDQWKDDDSNNLQWITSTQKNNIVDYKYSYKTEDGGMIVLKKSYRDIPAFYKINPDSSETKIAVKDIPGNDDYFSYNNGKIVYAAFQPDARWGDRNFSVIKILDANTGEEKRISSGSKYFSPDISHDGTSIVAVEIKAGMQSSLVLMDENGTIKDHWQTAQHTIYSYPKFSADDKFIFVFVRNDRGEMGIEKREIANGKTTTIIPFQNRIIGFPVVTGDTLLYTCSNNGLDEIWACILSQNKNYRLASYSTGLYQAFLQSDGNLTASAFTANGYRLASVKPKWQPVNDADTLKNSFVTKPFNQKENNTLYSLSPAQYSIEKYPNLFHPFNFHSWNPYFNQPDYSFIVYGENVLNTFESQLYYTYNSNEKYHRAGYTGIFGRWYVQPIVDISHTWDRSQQFNADTTFTWNELNASAGLRLPLNLSGGKQYRNLTLTATYNIDQLRWTGLGKQLLRNLNFNYAQLRFVYNSQSQRATQQILPRWGQSFLMQYRTIVTNHTARQFLASASFYLPGFAKTHNIVFNAAYQSRDTSNEYYFTNNFPFSRGYDALNFPRVWKLGANYHLPLLLPDWGFGNIVFFKRIRANVFYDYTAGKSLRTGNKFDFRTVGSEIYFDTKWWNQQPITFGVRYSHLLDDDIVGLGANQWEFILPVSLY